MEKRGVKLEQGDLSLPPGFRFHPTDEEVITSYLLQKLLNPSFSPQAMGEVNLNQCEPWDLPSKAKMGEKEWYFFCHKDMKYPTGIRTNRATKKGYWKATGRDREIFKPASASSSSSAAAGRDELVGMKKTLVFYMGRAPRGSKTNWVMHEFRVEGKCRDNNDGNLRLISRKDEWVVCKVFHKNSGDDKIRQAAAAAESSVGTPNVSSISVADATGDDGDDFIHSLLDPMYFNAATTGSLPNITTMDAAADYSIAYTNDHLMPNYAFSDTTSSRNLNQEAAGAVANSTVVPTSGRYSYSSPSWNLLHAAGHPAMGISYNLHDQAMMARALGGVISPPNFSGGLPSSSSSVPGVLQQNSLGLTQHNIGSFSDNTATTHLTRRAAPGQL